jgi:hypothetical protein
MGDRIFWPGQVPIHTFSLEQLRAVGSASRAEVFWAYNSTEPQSVFDIGRAIKKSPQTVRYHTNELLKQDLIFPVEFRKRRSRTEEAYVHRAVNIFTEAQPMAADYLVEVVRGHKALFRQLDRDRTAALRLGAESAEYAFLETIRISSVRLTKAQIREARTLIIETLKKIEAMESTDGVRISYFMAFAPVFGETAAIYETLTGQKLKNDFWGDSKNGDHHEDDDDLELDEE